MVTIPDTGCAHLGGSHLPELRSGGRHLLGFVGVAPAVPRGHMLKFVAVTM
jgi:hypothetical protein